jgi:hypothetical protein
MSGGSGHGDGVIIKSHGYDCRISSLVLLLTSRLQTAATISCLTISNVTGDWCIRARYQLPLVVKYVLRTRVVGRLRLECSQLLIAK